MSNIYFYLRIKTGYSRLEAHRLHIESQNLSLHTINLVKLFVSIHIQITVNFLFRECMRLCFTTLLQQDLNNKKCRTTHMPPDL